MCLALVATVMLSMYNMVVGELAELGAGSLNYFGTGALIPSIVYFIRSKEWSKRNTGGILDSDGEKKRKVLLRTWGNNFDWWTFFLLWVQAGIEVIITVSIAWNFKVCHSSGLNIGIAVGIWSIDPFLISVLERIF